MHKCCPHHLSYTLSRFFDFGGNLSCIVNGSFERLPMKVINDSRAFEDSIYRDYRIAAMIVDLYGEVYLPGFLRIHEEIEKRRSLEDAKLLALVVAKGL